MGPRRSGTGRLGTPGGLKTPEMAPMGGTPPRIISNSIDTGFSNHQIRFFLPEPNNCFPIPVSVYPEPDFQNVDPV